MISRRSLISGSVAASALALIPPDLVPACAESRASGGPVRSTVGQPAAEQETAASSGKIQADLLALAHQSLVKLFDGKTIIDLQPEADRLDFPPAQRLNITLRTAGRIRGSMSAPGTNLGRQTVQSVFHTAMDTRYGGHLSRWEVSEAILEIWIQTGSSEIVRDDRSRKGSFLLGVEGLEIEGLGRLAYYKPSVAITSKYKSEVALMEALCKKAKLEPGAWQQPDVTVRKTQWLCLGSVSNAHFFGPPSVTDSRTPLPLDHCIGESASYLTRNQDIDGCTAYLYDPISDQFVSKKTNLVRSAGSLFALSQVLQSNHPIAKTAAFKNCVMQMARGLLHRTSLFPDGIRVVEEDKAKDLPGEDSVGDLIDDRKEPSDLTDEEKSGDLPGIGATALLAAALSFPSLRKEFGKEYAQLYQSIKAAQKPDGRFVTHFGEESESVSAANYYSGESLLVLAMAAERGNTEALEMCRRAFPPYVLQFRSAPTSAFVGWHVDVWSRIAILTGDHKYAEFAFEQIDWLLPMQVKDHADPRYVGGFSQFGNPPQFSTIVFLEAVVRAQKLAVKTGDHERAKRYQDCVHSGLQFCKQLRLEETQATLLGNPLRCKGGIALGLVDRRVRCDIVQHFITLCLAVEQ